MAHLAFDVVRMTTYPHTARCAEHICALLAALAAGRRTRAQLADELGVCTRTITRYLQVMSLYFPIVDEGEAQQVGALRFYWLDSTKKRKL